MISQSIVFIWRGVGIANVSLNAAVVDIRQCAATTRNWAENSKESSAMEIWAASASGKLHSCVNQTEQANLTYNAIYFTLVKVNATFVRRTRPLASHGRGIRGQGFQVFCAPP